MHVYNHNSIQQTHVQYIRASLMVCLLCARHRPKHFTVLTLLILLTITMRQVLLQRTYSNKLCPGNSSIVLRALKDEQESISGKFFSLVTLSTAPLNFELGPWVVWTSGPKKKTPLFSWFTSIPYPALLACLHQGGLTAKSLLSQAGHVAQMLPMESAGGFCICFCFPDEVCRPGHPCPSFFPALTWGMTTGTVTVVLTAKGNLSQLLLRAVLGTYDAFRSHEHIFISFRIRRKNCSLAIFTFMTVQLQIIILNSF